MIFIVHLLQRKVMPHFKRNKNKTDETSFDNDQAKHIRTNSNDKTNLDLQVPQIQDNTADFTQVYPSQTMSYQENTLGGMTPINNQYAQSSSYGGASTGKNAHPHLVRNIFITLGVIIAALAIAYVGISIFFMSHFGFNTQISGIDCSFKTASEVETLLGDKAKTYKLTIYERTKDEATKLASEESSSKTGIASTQDTSSSSNSSDSSSSTTSSNANATTGVTGSHTEKFEGSDISLQYSGGSNEVETMLNEQNSFAWIMRFFNKEDTSSKVTFSYDKDKLKEICAKLACMDNSNAVEPKDAYPEFNGSNYVVHNEVPGNKVDTEKAQAAITEAVTHAEPELDLSSEGCYFAPAVVSTTKELQDRVKLLDKYVPFALTYTFTDGSNEILDGETIFDWLTIKDDGSYEVDDDQISTWVEEFAGRHTTVGHERSFTSVDGNTYTVSGGTYGWKVDQSEEISSIKNMLETKQSETREPHWASKAAVSNATGSQPDWGNTYIELNLTAQHVYFIKDGQKTFEADVVTGLPTAERETPAGVYSVLEKQRNKTLTGNMTAAGVPEYETPVSYWIRMTWTGVGFHDATWQSSFGGTAYKTRGSHGCINMSLSDVSQLYDLVETGTPIVSHY